MDTAGGPSDLLHHFGDHSTWAYPPSPPIPVPATVLCAERSVDNWRHFAYKSREPEAPRGSCPRISFLRLPKQITTDLEA